MSYNPVLQATIKSTGEKINVYVQASTGSYVNYQDCKTTYRPGEIIITPTSSTKQ